MKTGYGRFAMRRQTFSDLLLLMIFVGALLPTMVVAQSVSAAGPAQRAAQHEPAQQLPAREAPSAEDGLTLDQLQGMALANNPTLAQAKAGVRAAAGRSRQAGLWPNPTIGYSGDEIRGGSFGGGEQGVFVQQNVILGGKLSLDRKIFDASRQSNQTWGTCGTGLLTNCLNHYVPRNGRGIQQNLFSLIADRQFGFRTLDAAWR